MLLACARGGGGNVLLRTLVRRVVELLLVAVAVSVLLWAALSPLMKRPRLRLNPRDSVVVWRWEGCWLTVDAKSDGAEESDWICAV
jgi:hypothetical protein